MSQAETPPVDGFTAFFTGQPTETEWRAAVAQEIRDFRAFRTMTYVGFGGTVVLVLYLSICLDIVWKRLKNLRKTIEKTS